MARKATPRIPRSIGHVSFALQSFHIQNAFPQFSGKIHRGRANWCGSLQPSLSSPVYYVKIIYQQMGVPKVHVTSPALAPGAPHMYPEDSSLCLYWPDEWRWRPDKLIADTILPWTASWLYYYELWLDTDRWLGPSSHDRIVDEKKCQHV